VCLNLIKFIKKFINIYYIKGVNYELLFHNNESSDTDLVPYILLFCSKNSVKLRTYFDPYTLGLG